MEKHQHIKIWKLRIALVISIIFIGAGSAAGTDTVLYEHFNTTAFLSKLVCAEPFTGYLKFAESVTFDFPANISVFTNRNSCDALISSGLNIPDPFKRISSLSWQIEGASEARSPSTGIHQLRSFVFNKGTSTVSYFISDVQGQFLNYSFTVVVKDNQSPRFISSPGNIIVSNAAGECSTKVNWVEPVVTDNCISAEQLIVHSDHKSGDTFPVGTTEVIYTVSDGENATIHRFDVTVSDNEAPLLTAPEPLHIFCGEGMEDAFTTWEQFENAGGSVTDNCEIDFSTFRYLSQTSTGIRCPYIITREYGIADKSGNFATVKRIIEVSDESLTDENKEPDISETFLKSGTATQASVTFTYTDVTCFGGNDGTVNLTIDNITGTLTITWLGSNGGSGYIQGNEDQTSLTAGDYTVEVSDDSGTQTLNFTITEPSVPIVNPVADQTLCNGATLSTITFTGTASRYDWTNSSPSIGLASSGSGNITPFSVTNSGSTPVTASIVVTPVYENGGTDCNGDPETFTITVNPTPIVNPVASQTVCNNGSTTTVAFSGTATRYDWTNSNTTIGLAANGSGNIASFNATNGATSPLTATITVTPVYIYNSVECTGTQETFTISVNPDHSLSLTSIASTTNQQVCINNSLTDVTFSVGGGATGALITSGTLPIGVNGTYSGGVFTISGTPGESGTFNYTITTSGNGCTLATANGTIVVLPDHTLTLTSGPATKNQNICFGASITPISYQLVGGAIGATVTSLPTGINANVSGSSLTISGAAVQSGTFNFSLETTGNACMTATDGGVITVGEQLSIDSAVVTIPIDCNGGTATVTIGAIGGFGPYSFTFNGETNTNGIFSNVYAGANLQFQVNDANGCGPVYGNITIDEMAPMTAMLTPSPLLCNGGVASGEIEVSNPGGGSGTYEVSIGAGWFTVSGASPYIFSGLGTGNYYVQIRDAANPACIQNLPVVSISEPPVFNAEVIVSLITCFGETSTVQVSATGGTPGSPSYRYFINNVEDTDGDGIFELAGSVAGISYDWKAVDANGCEDGGTISITQPDEIANPLVTVDDNEICTGENIVLHASSSGGTAPLRYNWSGPNNYSAVNSQNPVRTNASNLDEGWYVLTVLDVNNCSKKDSVYVTVHPLPAMTNPPDYVFCGGTTNGPITFSGDAGNTYTWTNDNPDSGIPSSGTNEIPVFTSPDSFDFVLVSTITVTPTSADGCQGNPVSFTITINPKIESSITNNTPVFCGNGNVSIVLNSNVSGTTFYWDYSNGSAGSGNIVNEFLNSSYSYTIYAEANGCYSDTLIATVTVINENFDLEVNTSGPNATDFCPGETFDINFTGSSSGSGSWQENPIWYRIIEYQWETKFHYSVNNPNVVVSATSGPIDDSAPANLNFEVMNNTGQPQTAIVSITPWAYEMSRECTYNWWRRRWECDSWPSTWNQLCSGDSYEVEITVQPYTIVCPADVSIYSPIDNCEANFFHDNSAITSCASVNTTITWDLAGATSISGQSGDIDYDFNLGVTTVTLTSTDPDNPTDPNRTCSFDITVIDTVSPTINCLQSDTTIYVSAWNCGAGYDFSHIQATDNCAVDQFMQTEGPASGSEFPIGTSTLGFYAEDASGNFSECNFNVIVADTISPVINCIGDTTVCADPGMDYTHIGTAWNAIATDNCVGISVDYLVDGSSLGNTLNNVSFSVGGSPHTVIATATDAAGRTASCTFRVTVNEKPEITLDPLDQSVCLNGTVSLSAAASGTPLLSFQWRMNGVSLSDDTYYSGSNTETLTITNLLSSHAGNYDVVVTNSCGLATSAPAILFVSSAPEITQQPASQANCLGEDVDFLVTVSGGVVTSDYTYEWDRWDITAGDWTSISGANTFTLSIANIGTGNNTEGTQYRVRIEDDCGNKDTSGIVTLTVSQMDAVSLVTETLCKGESTSFTAYTLGAMPVSYEWFKDGILISGETTQTINLLNVALADSGIYSARAIFNATGGGTCAADPVDVGRLIMDDGPEIVAALSAPVICSGSSFAIDLSNAEDPGNGSTTYSWTRSNVPELSGVSLSGIGSSISGTLVSTDPGTMYTMAFYVTAMANGCESMDTVLVSVGDTITPVLSASTPCPSNIMANNDLDDCGALVNYTTPLFDDNCDGTDQTGILMSGLNSGSVFPMGTITVIWEFTDNAENGPVSCSFDVTVTDIQPPTASCQAFSVELDASGLATIAPADINYNSVDNCGIDSLWLDITTFNCTNLGDNTIVLTVRDSSGLTDQCLATVTVLDNNNPVDITVSSISQTPIECYGGLATVTISASGGIGTLSYTLGSESNQTGIFNNVSAGFYNWRISDLQHCGDTISSVDFEVVQPGELTAIIALTEVTCSSGNDGTITVIGSSGGSGDYEFRLESSVENRAWQSDSLFGNLSPGFYNILMRDANAIACEKIIQNSVEVYILTADISSGDITCYGGNDGEIDITNPAGGTAPYQYSVDGTSWSSTGNFTGLSADTFEVRIQDNDGCMVILDSLVILSQPDSLDATITSGNVSCGGANDGTIILSSVSGGTGSYQYSVDGGSNWQLASAFLSLVPGLYEVWIMDGSSCTKALGTIEITELPPLTADLDSSNINCNSGNDGTIIISNPGGGSGSYEYSIDGGTSWQDNGNYTGLTAGSYQVFIRDSNAVTCDLELSANLVLSEPAALLITSEPTDFVDCAGVTAQFLLAHSVGVGIVSYSWQKEIAGTWTDLTNTGDISGVGLSMLQIANIELADTGQYRVIVSDNCAADTSITATLTVNDILLVSPGNVTTEICAGSDTAFTVSVSGENPVYQWHKLDGSTWQNVSDNGITSGSTSNKLVFSGTTTAESGEYRVVVTFNTSSASECSISSESRFERHLNVLPAPALDSIPDFTYCEGDFPAPIPLVGSPANVTYDLTASNYIGLFNQTNITSGQIVFPSFVTWGKATITVTPKANGCVGEPRSFVIDVSPKPIFSVAPPFQTICSDVETNIIFNGNTDSIRYNWTVAVTPNDGSVTGWEEVADSLATGIRQTLHNSNTTSATVTYTITPTKNGCTGLTNTVTITVRPAVDLLITDPDTVCDPDRIDLTDPSIIAGSTPGLDFEYYLDSNLFSYVSNPLSVNSGTYFIKATNPATTCYKVQPVTVTIVPPPVLAIHQPDPICPTQSVDLQTTIDVSATTPGLNFTYWDVDTNQILSQVVSTDGTYFIKGETPEGCYDFKAVVVVVYTDVQTPVFDDGYISSVCQGDSPRIYSASAVNATGLTYSIDALSQSAGNSINPSSGEVTFAPGYTGDIIITVTATGCTAPTTAIHTITVHEPPTVTLTPLSSTICRGESVVLTANSVGSSVNETYSGSSAFLAQIPETGPSTTTTVNLSGSGGATLSSTDILIVTVDITHGRDEQIDMYLVDPSGTRAILLSSDNGGRGDNYENTIFRTDGTISITSGIAPFNGTYLPEGSIANSLASGLGYGNLEGASIDGTWTLLVFDDTYDNRRGTLNSWDLSIVKMVGSGFITMFNGPDEIGPVNYSGSLNETATVIVTPTSEGILTYTATTTDANGCVATSNEVTIVVNETPSPFIAADYCAIDGKIQLTALGGTTGSSYSWTTTETSNYIVVDEVNIYGVTITNPNGCAASDYLDVSHELVLNGDFEAGNTSFASGYGFRPSWTYPALATTSTNSSLWDENYYGIGANARYYHTNFWGHQDHTSGDGYFMIVNGNLNAGTPIWEETVNVLPNTNYYFSAWSMSLNSVGNDAVLQFEVNGVLVGTQARLDPGVSNDSNNGWVRFYSDPLWNSGSISGQITIRIRNVEPAASGNDFALDDISFGTLDPLPLEIEVQANAVCEGDTLFLQSNSVNGMEPITYYWSGPNNWTSNEMNPVIPNISLTGAGQYKLEATDGYGCEILPDSLSLIVETAPTVDAGPDVVVCSSDSVIQLNGIIGGSASLATWSGGLGIFNPGVNAPESMYTLSPAEISAGMAILVLSTDDPSGECEPVNDTLIITIHESPLIDSIATKEPLCNSVNDGTARIYVSGGVTPYTYLWSTGHTTTSISGLKADTFWVQVTDANLCVVSDTFIIEEPEPFIISPTSPIIVPPSCYGADDGWALVEVSGGIPPYRFDWDANADPAGIYQDTAFNLPAGIYYIYVTDSAFCAASNIQVTVPQPPPPILTCPPDYEDMISPDSCSISFDTLLDPYYNGFCDVTLSFNVSGATSASGTGSVNGQVTFNIGQSLVEYRIEDSAGNIDSCSFTVWIKHIEIPTSNILCPDSNPAPAYADVNCEAYVLLDLLTFTDPCNEIDSVWNNSPADGATPVDASGTYPIGSTEFTWYVLDKSGNMDSTCVVQVIVLDTTKPNISCPVDAVDSAAANMCSKVPATLSDPTFDDDCSTVVLTWEMTGATTGTGTGTVTDSLFNVGTTSVTYFVEDEAGNRDTCTFNVQIVDVTDPFLTIGCESVTDTAAANFCSKVSGKLKDPVYNDNCWDTDSLTLSWEMIGATTGSGLGSVKDSTFLIGVTTVTYTVTDPDGNTAECTFTVTIVDIVEPEITIGCADVQDVLAPDKCSMTTSVIDDPVLYDNCWDADSLTLSWTMSGATLGSGSGSVADSTFNVGVTTVIYTVSDPDGLSASCSFDVTILHLEIPTANFTCPDDSVWATASAGRCDADVTLDALLYTDLCNDIDSVWNESPYRTSPEDASGLYPVGSTTFYWYITDISGNIDSCTVTVIVADLPPTLLCPPNVDTTADFSEMFNSGVILADPAYDDNCPDPELSWWLIPPVDYTAQYNSAELNGTGVYVSPDTFWIGVTTIWYKVIDAQGNADSCSFTVTVTAAPSIVCPPDTTIYLGASASDCSSTFDPGVPDLIEGAPPITWTYTIAFADGSSEGPISYTKDASDSYANPLGDRTFPLGVSTISWRAENNAGFDTCSHWVEVIDTIPPTLTTQPYENCVDPLQWVTYNPTNPNPVFNHVNPNLEKYPVDFRTMYAGETFLDVLTVDDNCCDSGDLTIHWRIDFSDIPDPLTGISVSHPSITGTGQPSSYQEGGIPTDIHLWGDGVTFQEVVHHIYYWVEDCNGNTSDVVMEEIKITPRPQIIKVTN